MTDALLFIPALGVLRPADEASAAAVRQLPIGAALAVRISRSAMNTRRMAFYRAVLAVAADNLGGVVEGPFDADVLHRLLKRKLGFGEWVRLPSGDAEFVPRSLAARVTSEPMRADYIQRALAVLEAWLGVPADDLLNEAHARNPALGGVLPGGRAAKEAM
jgi:hypothetical protein